MNATEKISDLLNVAHDTLVNEVVPSLTKQDRYNSLMVANALRVVGRHFLSTQVAPVSTPAVGLLDDAAVVKGIRTGQFDEGSSMRAALVTNLRNRLVQQLSVDNPRMLEQFVKTSPQAH